MADQNKASAFGTAVTVGGTRVDENALVEYRVYHSLQLPSRLTLCLRDNAMELVDGADYTIGKPVEVRAGDGSAPIFKGEVTAVEADFTSSGDNTLTVSGYDRSHRLSHATKTRTFLKQSYAGVLQTIAGEYGLQARVGAASLATVFDHLQQSTSDYEFLHDICRRTGTVWWLDDRVLNVSEPAWDRDSGLRFRYGDAAAAAADGEIFTRRFKVRYSAADHAEKVVVSSWDPTSKQTVEGKAEATKAASAFLKNAPKIVDRNGAKAIVGVAGLTSGSVVTLTEAEAKAMATAQAARRVASGLVARWEARGTPEVRPGIMVTLTAGTKPSGRYYVTEVEHVYDQRGGFVTLCKAVGVEPAGLADLTSANGHDAAAFGQTGFVVGLVTNNKDDQNLGRIKVKFPTLGAIESDWARIVIPGGGETRGWALIPEVGDEVLVGFEGGDTRRPFVLGGLWNTVDKPTSKTGELVKDGKVEKREFRSRVGHVLAFNDGQKEDEKNVRLQCSDSKTFLFLGEDKVELVSNKKTIELRSGKASIVLDGQSGDIKINGNNVTIAAKQELVASATAGWEAKGATVKLEAKSMLDLKASGQANLQASGPTNVKGAIVKIN